MLQTLAQKSGGYDTVVVEVPKRYIAVAAAILVIAGVIWSGLQRYRTRMEQRRHEVYCEHKNAEFTKRIDLMKQDARELLKIGTRKAGVSQFFSEHGMTFSVLGSEAIGQLYTTGGCEPIACGTDRALIGVRVEIDADGTVTGEPEVVAMYVDCA